MIDESDASLLRRNVAEMRALLDLGYARERALLESCKGLLFLLEGAAVAPDKQDKQEKILVDARKAAAAMFVHPALNHGLLFSFLTLQARSLAQDGVIQQLRGDLLSHVSKFGSELSDAGVKLQIEQEIGRNLARLVGAPELADRVREVVERAVAEMRSKPKEET